MHLVRQFGPFLAVQSGVRLLRSTARSNPFTNVRRIDPAINVHQNDPFPSAPANDPKSPIQPTENAALAIDDPDHIDWSLEMQHIRASERRSVLEPTPAGAFDPQTAVPLIRPTHNLAAYVQKSATLQQLIRLGVDLHRIERRAGLAQFVLRLDFERDVQPHLRLLTDCGVPAGALGSFVSRNPLLFRESLDALRTRINYLQSKRFAAADIGRIVQADPHWLMFSTQRIDGRLGFFQREFALTGAQMRQLVVRQPRLITYRLDAVRRSTFVLREEFGFSADETQRLLLNAPKLWMMNEASLVERFEYVHQTMGIALERIVGSPELLNCRAHRLRERHGFLERLGRAQFDPRQPLFVSFGQLCSGSDEHFATEVARSTFAEYEAYLRTL